MTSNNNRQQTTDDRGHAPSSTETRTKYPFRELLAGKTPQEQSLRILDVGRGLPVDRASVVHWRQPLRPATSTAANVAEGHRRCAARVCRDHCSIARGSTHETLSRSDLLRRAGYERVGQGSELVASCDDTLRMLAAHHDHDRPPADVLDRPSLLSVVCCPLSPCERTSRGGLAT
ncbi:MAG: four helix bundle protein [Dehalococcoidia bacterium]|nr:four helix bundle protein [Dehalococcoidia bacterium]